jgi:RND family efflux transporter MFP subunit
MNKNTKRIIHMLATLTFIGLGVVGFILLTANKPQLKKTQPPVPVPMVSAVSVQIENLAIPIVGEGTVRPQREIQLVPQVSGPVIAISPALINGGDFKKGDVLLHIDPVDYQLAVTLARARVKDSESALQLAQGEAAAAQEEWHLLNKNSPEGQRDPPALVAKIPQLEAARAKLAADRADLQKAGLNLKRTQFIAPFNGRVSEENVDIGQYVSIGQSLATLFSTDEAEIVVPFEDESLFWFHVPGFTPGSGLGSPAKIKARIAGRNLNWIGRVDRAEGKLDEGTRLINVVIRVEKPYNTKPPLAVGLFVSVEIQGPKLEDAAVIPRPALRQNDVVWVVDKNGRLSFRKVEIARILPDKVILKSGLLQGEMIVTSPLKAVTDGMRVRIGNYVRENAS